MDYKEEISALKEQSQKTLEIVTELKMAIVGSHKIGVEGIINKINRHEKYIENDKRQKWMIAGGVTVISILITFFISIWNKIFS